MRKTTKHDFEVAGCAAFVAGGPMMAGTSWQANAFNAMYVKLRDARPLARVALLATPVVTPVTGRHCVRAAEKVRAALVRRWQHSGSPKPRRQRGRATGTMKLTRMQTVSRRSA